MTDTPTSQPALPAPPPRRRGRTAFLVTLVALVAAMAGAFGTTAFSQGFGMRGWHRGPGFMMGGDPARIEERADRMVRHLAVELDATSEQQEQLRGIVKAALKDLLPMREKVQALRQRGRELLLAPTVDRAAIESLRVEHMALADTFSKRVSQALADASSVLTADQRRKLAEMWPPRGGRGPGGPGGRWHRG
jgi:Spy/CpxP family protein refolding chaperone